MGVASFFENGLQGKNVRKNAEALIKSAESAIYSAKEAGKNRVALAGRQP